MRLNEIGAPAGANKASKRKGRGPGSGNGKTAGRGQKGAGARKSANKGRMTLEGGNFPLWRSTPKRGFSSRFARDTQIVNLSKLELLGLSEIDAEILESKGMIRSASKPVKILGTGELTKSVTVKVTAVSKAAAEAIEKAGGKVELV
jgi:large subunit ribosomal protein L15